MALIGIMGTMGSGKTLSMSVIATALAQQTGAELHANYGLKNSKPIESLNDVWDMNASIFCFDEIWLSADSRQWKDNVQLSHWINQTRKKKMLVFYTTQHIRQVEMRIRKGTDILIVCEKKPEGIWLNFIDYQYLKLGRRFLMRDPKRFYPLYDTYEVLKPLSWSKKKDYTGFTYGKKSYR